MMRKGVKKLQALNVRIGIETDPHPAFGFSPVVKLSYVFLVPDTGQEIGIVSDPSVRLTD